MRQLPTILLLFIFSCSEPMNPPTEEQMKSIRNSMEIESEERWANWDVKYQSDDEYLFYRVAVHPFANDIAIKGYMNLIKGIHRKHAKEYDCSIRIMKMGERKLFDTVRGEKP